MLDRLLGLEKFSWRNPGLSLSTEHGLPVWGWGLVVLAAIALAVWMYRGPSTRGGVRVLLVVLRAAVLVFCAWLLVGPQLVLSREKVEPDRVLILVDRSASMRIQDCDSGPGRLQSRDDALRGALSRYEKLLSTAGLGVDHRLIWLGFDSACYPIDPAHLPPAKGQSTALVTALQQAMKEAEGAPIGGVVVISDGRATQQPTAELFSRLQQQAVSLFTVPVGYDGQVPDLILAQVDAPQRAFINDPVPVSAQVQLSPPDAQIDLSQVEVRLVDRATSQILDRQPAASRGLDQPIVLSGRAHVVGLANWTVEVAYEGPDPSAGTTRTELTLDNNRQDVQVELIDRPVKVLYIEGYPRWEYRYLKNVLVRETSVDSSILLLSADKDFVQEGDNPITRPPRDAHELKEYDVIILGDVEASYFTPQQLALFRDHVSLGGAGLLWIAGLRAVPASYDGTPLADLLPMPQPGRVAQNASIQEPFQVRPTPLAVSLSILRLALAGEPSDPAIADWPPNLPPLYWAQSVGPLKPLAEVLAEATPPHDSAQRTPLVLRQRFGSGQSIYVATDETWRWRYGRGDLYFERFWLQLIRMLARERVVGQSNAVQIHLPQRRVEVGQPVVLELRVHDAMLLDRREKTATLKIEATAPDADHSSPLRAAELGRVELTRADDPSSDAESRLVPRDTPNQEGYARALVYRGVWRPQTPGSVRLTIHDDDLAPQAQPVVVEVLDPTDERRHMVADYPMMRMLAQRTGGEVVPLDQLDRLTTLIPNRAKRTPDDIREALWDSPLTLVIVLTLLTVEWVLRKLVKLA